MIKCIECGKENSRRRSPLRYATPDGSFCCDCWENKDQKFKDAMLKRALYGAAVRGARFLNAINKKGGKG